MVNNHWLVMVNNQWLSILPCSDIPKSSNHKEIPMFFVDDLPIPIPYPHDSWVSSRRLMGMLFCRNCGQRRSGTGLDAMDFASAFGGIKDAVREEQQRHLDGHVSYIHQVYPMDPWRLRRYGELPSHHAPVILPFRSYGWIHRYNISIYIPFISHQ